MLILKIITKCAERNSSPVLRGGARRAEGLLQDGAKLTDPQPFKK